jgi:CBS domain-containing protein
MDQESHPAAVLANDDQAQVAVAPALNDDGAALNVTASDMYDAVLMPGTTSDVTASDMNEAVLSPDATVTEAAAAFEALCVTTPLVTDDGILIQECVLTPY